MADESHRSAEQLIAALEAGEIDPREFLLEARALRSDDELLLPDALRDAVFDQLPTLAPIIGQNGGIGTLCEAFALGRALRRQSRRRAGRLVFDIAV